MCSSCNCRDRGFMTLKTLQDQNENFHWLLTNMIRHLKIQVNGVSWSHLLPHSVCHALEVFWLWQIWRLARAHHCLIHKRCCRPKNIFAGCLFHLQKQKTTFDLCSNFALKSGVFLNILQQTCALNFVLTAMPESPWWVWSLHPLVKHPPRSVIKAGQVLALLRTLHVQYVTASFLRWKHNTNERVNQTGTWCAHIHAKAVTKELVKYLNGVWKAFAVHKFGLPPLGTQLPLPLQKVSSIASSVDISWSGIESSEGSSTEAKGTSSTAKERVVWIVSSARSSCSIWSEPSLRVLSPLGGPNDLLLQGLQIQSSWISPASIPMLENDRQELASNL